MSKRQFQHFGLSRLLIIPMFFLAGLCLFAPQAQAQTSFLNAILGSQYGNYIFLNLNGVVFSRSFTTDAGGTVTSLRMRLANSGLQSSGTLSSNLNLTVGGNPFSFSNYGEEFITTFTGNAVLEANTTYEIRMECNNCYRNNTILYGHSSSSSGWSFTTAQKFEVRLLGETSTAPVLSAIGAQTHRQNQASVSVTTGATDANSGDTLTFSASNLPTGLSINPSTGTISGMPSAAGTFNPTVTVSDGALTDSRSLSWTISPNNAPVMSAIGNQTGTLTGLTILASRAF